MLDITMERCGTCSHRNSEGHCKNPNLAEVYDNYDHSNQNNMLIYPYQEGGHFWVGENFGCVHHEIKQICWVG